MQKDPMKQTPKSGVGRRDFLKTSGAAALTVGGLVGFPNWAIARDSGPAVPESTVKTLFGTLSEEQRTKICFPWDHMDPERGLLRTRISANWNITDPSVDTKFFSDDQRDLIRQIYEGIIHPDWHARIDQQLEDDAGGWGHDQTIAIFGTPGEDKFQFVMTGRHMTIRCDGDSAEHMAFGGPIFYGHAADGLEEAPDHPGNVFWPQALEANKLYTMLDGKQRKLALLPKSPGESRVAFRGPGGELPGIPLSELSADQKEHAQLVLQKLIEPYRQSDRDEAIQCLKAQGGLDACHLSFYQDEDLGEDGVWDNWRLEGPSFVWHFRGSPHVHVWVNVADSPLPELNA